MYGYIYDAVGIVLNGHKIKLTLEIPSIFRSTYQLD